MKKNKYLAHYYIFNEDGEVTKQKATIYCFNSSGAVGILMDKPNYLCMYSLKSI